VKIGPFFAKRGKERTKESASPPVPRHPALCLLVSSSKASELTRRYVGFQHAETLHGQGLPLAPPCVGGYPPLCAV